MSSYFPPQPTVRSAEGPELASLVFRPEYSDEFDGATVDTSKWCDAVSAYNGQQWSLAQASQAGSILSLTTVYNPTLAPGQTSHYVSGLIKSTAAPVLYGFFECRLKAADFYPGLCPAFWAFHCDTWPPTLWHEIDFVELTQPSDNPAFDDPCRADMTALVFVDPALPTATPTAPKFYQGRYYAPQNPWDNFHVYGCWWTANAIHWYLDGKLVHQHPTNPYWHQPLDIVCCQSVREPLLSSPGSAQLPAAAQFDYVRVWQ